MDNLGEIGTAAAIGAPTIEGVASLNGAENLAATPLSSLETPIVAEPALDAGIADEIGSIVDTALAKPLADVESAAGIKALSEMPDSPEVDNLSDPDVLNTHPEGKLTPESGAEISDNLEQTLATEKPTNEVPIAETPNTSAEQMVESPQDAMSNLRQEKDALVQKEQSGTNLSAEEQSRLGEIKTEIAERSEMQYLIDLEASGTELTDDQWNRLADLEEKFEPVEEDENPGETDETKVQKEALDDELDKAVDDLTEGKITMAQYKVLVEANQQSRDNLVENLLLVAKEKSRPLTDFEKEVAEKAARMKMLFIQVLQAKRNIKPLEDHITELKAKFKIAEQFQVNKTNEGSPEVIKNMQQRESLANMIAAQSANLADYSLKAADRYGEFLELNNDLDSMVGSRGWLRFAAVSIGSEFVKTANKYQLENKTRKVAKTARA